MINSDGVIPAFDLLLGVEIRAARIEGLLRADPVLAAQWRAEAAVAEAVASVGLEDVRLAEADLLVRIAEARAGGTDAPAAEDALSILRFLRAPGDPDTAPEAVLERIARLARRDGESGGEPLPTRELEVVFAGITGRAPVLEALRASALYAGLTGRLSPVAERMVFVAVEGAARRAGAGRAGGRQADDPLRGLGGRIAADWIVLPALALGRGRFRAWSPGTARGARDLIEGVDLVLGQEIGRVISIRGWQADLARATEGRHGRSRLAEAGAAFGLEPVMTAGILAERLGVTSRGALNLIGELERLGLVRELTLRRAARIWATPGLAAKLAGSRTTSHRSRASLDADRPVEPLGETPAGQDLRQRHLKEENEESVRRALADFDAVLEEVDGILARRGTDASRR
ncbi:hypothetical protein LAZ40_04785 [Cereibacter sphaeroides]|uniref:helix-turn-helix domain-containing protein n=1 Tax=Cereibacter sphaeroides TaxID=1063 RepID=UPI001F416472|nr:helix-turn-helix domain-containing protein [Cereibacter sphaeroides]MCE6958372.1 hypothetical protein [Cereibacter sphaeroides]MCE6972239.1 hypothetical protein [Cereibacter sphaeroides]